jgi:photosystem II stability/assembly factor-like uncharacterized protein
MRLSFSCIRRGILAASLTLAPGVAGAQWQLVAVGTNAEFRGLSVVSDQVAWASGTRGTVAHTTDAGTTWVLDTVSGAPTADFRSVVGLSAQIAVAASVPRDSSSPSRIFRTTDGGKTWSLAYSAGVKGVFLDALAFWDAAHGIALSDPVNGHLYLLITDDGGKSWSPVAMEASPATLANEGAFAASGTCLAVWGDRDVWIGTGGAEAARVFHSADRGRTWTVSSTPVHAGNAQSGIFALAFRDASHGLAVGGDYTKAHGASANVALTDDGGRTWRPANGPLAPAFLSGVSYADPGAIVATGLGGTYVSLNGGDAWTQVDTVPLNAVRFRGAGIGLAAGPRGRIARFTGTPAAAARKP